MPDLHEKAAAPGTTSTPIPHNVDDDDNDGHLAVAELPTLRFAMLGVGLASGLFLSLLDASIVATSLYTIAVEFKEIDSINWVALAYTLAYLSCAVLCARISDVIGRKAAFLTSYVIFIAFSLGCGFAQNLQQLIACRALQGVGGAGLYSITMIIFPELTPDHKKKYVASIIGAVIAIAGVLGPVLGGILTEYASWRWIFWINGPVGGVSAILFLLTWPDKKYLPSIEMRKWKEVDFLGSFLLIAAAVLIVFPFQNTSTETGEWGEAIFQAPLLLGIFCLVCLLVWQWYLERRWPGKMAAALPLVLLRNRVYMSVVLCTICTGFPYMLSIYMIPNRFQVVNGRNALDAGIMLLPMLGGTAVGSAAGGFINGKKNRFFETLLASCALMLLGCALEITSTSTAELEPRVLGFLVFIGLGFGLSASSSTILAGVESPIREHASAQGIIAQVRILGGSLGIAASTAILAVEMRSDIASVVSLEQLSNPASAVWTLSPEQSDAIRTVYTNSFHRAMIACCGVLVFGMICTLGIYRRNRLSIEELHKERYREERERRGGAGTPEPSLVAVQETV
ncbi:major facilitator superfamily transporter [Bombardia bombarda]|uniref:Major facilitator superfamily transporter n=1 Tax=Bombardia bombarda TaxID=252184 RepID=A0AA39X9S5_9PEZI|nr:major facilitator superfamily transporter [Bombardia bombarda]